MPYSNISLITDPNLLFQQYDFIQLSHDENNYIIGRVVSYNSNSGEMVFTPLQVNGAGTYSSWKISLTGSPGPSGTSGMSSLVPGIPNSIVKINSDGSEVVSDGNLIFDGQTLTIDPFENSSGGNPIYRIIYHDEGTAGTAGLVVRGPIPGQPYAGTIENRVPRGFQHEFVVGSQNILYIDSQGFHTLQALIANTDGVYFQSLENDNSQDKFLVWDSSTSGSGLRGKVKWRSGAQGPAGTSGTSGLSGSSFMFLGGWSQNGGVSDVPYGFNDIVVWPTSGPNMIVYVYTSDGTAPIGSPAPNLDPNWKVMVAGGSDGTSGTSGQVGTSGTSGENGTSGTSGENGTSGTSGESGSSGTSGESGTSGQSGTSGTSGESGTSGQSGTSGTSGISGTSGQSGTSGSSGTSGTGSPGTSGTSGASTPGPQNYVQVLGSQVNSVSTLGVTIVSGSITTTGNPVKIQVTGDANPQSTTGWCRLQIHRNGTPVGNIVQAETAGNNVNVPYCVDFIDTPAAGTYTYSMATVSGIAGTFQFGEASGPTLSMIELSGAIGSSGTSGVSGTSGSSGSTGTSGSSGNGTSGTSGTSFTSPYSGNLNGTAGQSWMSSFGATTSINWNNGNVQTRTLAASETFTFANPQNGATYILVIKQAAAGSYSITWPTISWLGGAPPIMTATANKTDIYTFVYANSTYYGSYAQNF